LGIGAVNQGWVNQGNKRSELGTVAESERKGEALDRKNLDGRGNNFLRGGGRRVCVRELCGKNSKTRHRGETVNRKHNLQPLGSLEPKGGGKQLTHKAAREKKRKGTNFRGHWDKSEQRSARKMGRLEHTRKEAKSWSG